MKKLVLILFTVIALISAQNTTQKDSTYLRLKKPKRQDYIIFNFNWMTMLNAPTGLNNKFAISPFSRGFDIALMYDIPLGRSPLSFGVGVNFSFENYYVNQIINDTTPSDDNLLYFSDIKDMINIDNPSTQRDWTSAKLATGIVELPVEFRFRLKPHKRNTFKAAVGFKIGYVIDSWQKYFGPNFMPNEDLNESLRMVTYDIPAINRLRYGIFTRIGYSRFNAYFHYGFGNFFTDQIGPLRGNNLTIGFSFVPF